SVAPGADPGANRGTSLPGAGTRNPPLRASHGGCAPGTAPRRPQEDGGDPGRQPAHPPGSAHGPAGAGAVSRFHASGGTPANRPNAPDPRSLRLHPAAGGRGRPIRQDPPGTRCPGGPGSALGGGSSGRAGAP